MSEYSADQRQSSDFIDPLYYWNSIKSRIVWILLFTALVSAGAYYGLKKLTDVFVASTTVMIENSPSEVINIDDINRSQNPNKEYFLTQFEILRSRSIVERVVDQLNLVEHPVLQPKTIKEEPLFPFLENDEEPVVYTAEQLRRSVIKKVMESRTVSPISNTQLVNIKFESIDPVLARDVASAIAQEFIRSQAENLKTGSRQTNSWLTDRLEDLRSQLRQSEETLQAFRDEHDVVDMKGVSTVELDHVERLSSAYSAAKSDRIHAENQYNQIIHSDNGGLPESLLNVAVIRNDRGVQDTSRKLDDAVRAIDELSRRYGPKHPRMAEAQTHLQAVRALLEEQIQDIKETLRNQARAAQSEERELLKALNAAKGNLQDINRKEVRLSELQREVQTNREIYERFLTQAKVSNEVEDLSRESARIVDRAYVPDKPAKPNRTLLFALAAAGSFAFACLVAILRDAVDDTFSSPDDVENNLGANCFGLLPELSRRRIQGNLLQAKDKKSQFYLESLQSICTFLQLSQDQPRKQVVTITSALPGEGKSTTVMNMAKLLGNTNRVLLIDADFRRPSVATALGLDKYGSGLSNVLSGHVHWKSCVHSLDDSHVDVMTNGNNSDYKLSAASNDIIQRKVLHRLLEEIRQEYDHILIDAPPAVAMSDLLILAKHSNSLVFLIEAHKTSNKLLKRITKTLANSKIEIKGFILNKDDIGKLEKQAAYYGYHSI